MNVNTENSLIKLLKQTREYTTTDYISKKLDISEEEVDKRLNDLKQYGYKIKFIPHRGINLVSLPDRLTSSELKYNLDTKIIGKKHIYCFDKLSSTNDKAKDLAESGNEEGIVVLSESQTRGRGRMHRRWVSEKGGLYMSVVLKPKNNHDENAKFYLISSLAVCQALREETKVDCFIKWPNDIMINHKKVAGILTESSIYKGKAQFMIIGIGVNVNVESKYLPQRSTSLINETKKVHSLVDIAKGILKKLDDYYIKYQQQGISFAVNKWKDLSTYRDIRIKILNNKQIIEGVAFGIDEDSGALLIREDTGIIRPVLSIESLTVKKSKKKDDSFN